MPGPGDALDEAEADEIKKLFAVLHTDLARSDLGRNEGVALSRFEAGLRVLRDAVDRARMAINRVYAP